MSQILVQKYNGKVPNSLEKLKELPGVGQKTASVIVSQIFNEPAFPVDTHIHRLAYRWKLSSGKNVVQTEKDLKRIFPIDLWNKLHLQIIFFGREHCKSRKTKCSCVICSKYCLTIFCLLIKQFNFCLYLLLNFSILYKK